MIWKSIKTVNKTRNTPGDTNKALKTLYNYGIFFKKRYVLSFPRIVTVTHEQTNSCFRKLILFCYYFISSFLKWKKTPSDLTYFWQTILCQTRELPGWWIFQMGKFLREMATLSFPVKYQAIQICCIDVPHVCNHNSNGRAWIKKAKYVDHLL